MLRLTCRSARIADVQDDVTLAHADVTLVRDDVTAPVRECVEKQLDELIRAVVTARGKVCDDVLLDVLT